MICKDNWYWKTTTAEQSSPVYYTEKFLHNQKQQYNKVLGTKLWRYMGMHNTGPVTFDHHMTIIIEYI